MKNKTGVCRALLLVGMGLMIPCYLFTAGNTLLSPWPLYDRNRLALCLLTPLCLLLLLLLGHAAKAKVFETHERAVLLGFAAFYFVIQLVMASALRFTPVTDLEQCVTAARRLAQTGAFGVRSSTSGATRITWGWSTCWQAFSKQRTRWARMS